MYNGIGLSTPRGSGTSGYVQRNLSFKRPKLNDYKPPEDLPPPTTRKPNDDVLLHKSKRQIEVECLLLDEKLRDKGLSDDQVEEQVAKLRKKLTQNLQDKMKNMKEEVLVEEKQREMARLKDAFGIKEDHKEGRGFKFETEKQKQERLARIVAEEQKQKRRAGQPKGSF